MPRNFRPLLVVPLALAAACHDAGLEPGAGIQVTTAVAPTVFRAGERVTVTHTVENRGRREALLLSPCEDPFTLTTAYGAAVRMPERICILAVVSPRRLGPGERVALAYEWRGDVYRAGAITGGGAPIAPGEYRLRGHVEVTRRGARHVARVPGSTVELRVLP